MHMSVWLPILALLLGAILHSLSADDGASILERFGFSWRLPAKAIPPLILVLGIASGTLDKYVGGQDLEHALAASVTVAIASVFGVVAHHGITTGKGSGGAAVVFFVVMTVGYGSVGCTALARRKAIEITADLAECLLGNQDVPEEKAFALCGVQEAQKEIAHEMLAEYRRKSTQVAHDAAARAERETREKLAAACMPTRAIDAGAPSP